LGNVGIGTTTPFAKLQVFGGAAFGNGTQASFLSGADFQIQKNSNNNTVLGMWQNGVASSLIGSKANDTNFYLTNNYYGAGIGVASTSITITSAGNVGIGTAAPGYKLDVAGSINATGINMSSTGTLAMNNGNITGVGKLYVDTIDPLYNIGGVNYATYASAISGGVKEEYVGKIKIAAQNKTTKEYEAVLDFDDVDAGSDLWVWRQVIDFNKDNVEVLITPYGQFAQAYYLISGNRLIFRSDRQTEISYRLIGKRFDWRDHSTVITDPAVTGRQVK